MKEEGLTRREFTRESVITHLSGVDITISGCGSDSSSPTSSTPPAGGGGVNGAVSANHGHVAFVSNAQINAANDITVDISATAGHSHSIDLTGAEVTQIGNGQRVAKASTVSPALGSHNHNVTFN